MSELRRIGFCGLGTMGAGMVENLRAAGFEVAGYNRTVERAQALASTGMSVANSSAEAAEGADAVVVCVSNDDALEDVLFGEAGVFESLGAGALLLDCGTTSLELTGRIHAASKEVQVDFLDAPITGSLLGAKKGALTFMVGGETAHFERARPLFDAMGKHAVHAGDAGKGQAAKFALNMTQAVVLEGVLEGYALAKKLGVPIAKLSEIFENSAGKTGVGSFKTPYLQAGDYTPHFRLDLMHKDLHLALDEAGRRRVPLPAARAVQTLYDQGVAEGMGREDFLVLAKLLERWGDIELRDDP